MITIPISALKVAPSTCLFVITPAKRVPLHKKKKPKKKNQKKQRQQKAKTTDPLERMITAVGSY